MLDTLNIVAKQVKHSTTEPLWWPLVPPADDLCKLFGPRSGPTKCRA